MNNLIVVSVISFWFGGIISSLYFNKKWGEAITGWENALDMAKKINRDLDKVCIEFETFKAQIQGTKIK